MQFINRLRKFRNAIGKIAALPLDTEAQMLLLGKWVAENVKSKKHIKSLNEVEFKVFSQFGDDGIIQWLVNNLKVLNKTFIEFGVEDYRESNTRFLMMNDNWSGFVMDGSSENIKKIMNSSYYWKYDLQARTAFVTKENINSFLKEIGWEDIGLLSIDIDGNDYWIWKEIDTSRLRPTIIVLEYNSVFGSERSIIVPYKSDFNVTRAHYSDLYFGASLGALVNLSEQKGYAFIGCNSAGNNAYFVKKDRLKDLSPLSVKEGFVESKFRESRDKNGKFNYIRGANRIEVIKDLPVFNIETNKIESFGSFSPNCG